MSRRKIIDRAQAILLTSLLALSFAAAPATALWSPPSSSYLAGRGDSTDDCAPFGEVSRDDSVTPTLTLLWFDPQGTLPRGFETMASEVQAIFGAFDVKVAWKRCPLDASYDSDPRQVWVTLLPADTRRWRENDQTMGLVMKVERPIGTVWIYLAGIRRALGGSRSPWTDEAMLGQAMGRVVAHEIVHAVAPDAPHAAHGLMRAELGRGELLKPDVLLDSRSARALRAGLALRFSVGPDTPEPRRREE